MDTDIKQTKIIGIGLVVVALLIGAYYWGSTSKNPTELTGTTQSTVVSSNTQTQAPVEQSEPQQNTQAGVITNSQACLSIANNAEENDLGRFYKSLFVLQAHFKQSTGNCYYEMTGQHISEATNPTGNYYTVINYAPNDNIIAECVNPISRPFTGNDTETSCYLNGSLSTVAMFHLIEAQYLAN